MEPVLYSYLRETRKRHGLSTKELGAKLGVVPYTLTNMEYGHRICGELMARRLGEFFGEDWIKFLSEKY